MLPLVYNPRAGGGHGRARMEEAARALAKRGIATRPVATEGPAGASGIVERLAREDGERHVLVVGGDGTHSEAADGALRSGADVAIGLLPGGTGNDLLLDLGLTSVQLASERIADALRGGASGGRRIDVGLVEWPGGRRHFIGVFGTGFMAKVASLADRRLKWLGSRAYTVAVFPELARLRSPRTRLVFDGGARVVDEPLALVAVCNGPHMGGGMHVAPMARLDDGKLEIVALREVGRVGLLRLFPKIFDGTHVGEERVLIERATSIEIAPERASPLLADGEIFGSTPATVRVLPRALHVLS